MKKVKEVHSIKWKKVGNEKQFRFNHSVEARFDSAIFAIEKKKLDKAKKELEEGKKLLSERQKLIKLADRSECGWTTVSAYVTDDSEDTPEDERRISKAQNSANKALDSKREKSRVKSGSATYKFNHASLSHAFNSRLGADDASCQVLSTALSVSRSRISGQFRRGTCFPYGSEGHWRNSCPNLISSGRSDKPTK